MAKYAGNPNLPEGWEEVAKTREIDGVEWFVFMRDNDPEGRYLAVKVCADGRVENKANYWLSWDKERNKLTGRGADIKLLKMNRPELFKIVAIQMEYFS